MTSMRLKKKLLSDVHVSVGADSFGETGHRANEIVKFQSKWKIGEREKKCVGKEYWIGMALCTV